MPLLAGSADNDTGAPPEDGVTIHEGVDFGGASRVLVADVVDLALLQGPCGTGDGDWRDCISSITLPSGWTATLYELPDFKGDSLAVTSSLSNLTHFPGCDGDWNDCVTSIHVRKRVIYHDLTGSSETHPQDIPDEAGLFIYSHDGVNALRVFGSFRMLGVLDDTPTFHPY